MKAVSLFLRLVVLLVGAGGAAFLPSSAFAAGGICREYVPSTCKPVTQGSRIPSTVSECYVVETATAAPYVYDRINVLRGGAIYFVEDPGKTIDFRVSALLVEYGGIVQAGSEECPFGKNEGKLTIGLYGDDPTEQGTKAPVGSGIQCETNPSASQPGFRCFPATGRDLQPRDYTKPHYCTESNSIDPCSNKIAPGTNPKNFLLEPYGLLNFDTNSWGYKTIGVSYGGALRLYGWKGAKPLQDPTWGSKFDSNDNCPVPDPKNQSELDASEMKAWANLTGNSWVRLAKMRDEGDKTILTLDRLVSDWEQGDEIIIGATDWYPSHTEIRTVVEPPTRAATPDGVVTELKVDMLKYPHFATIFDAKSGGRTFSNPVNRSAVDMRATVGLLSRSIQVYSLGKRANDPFPKTLDCLHDRAKPDCYFGGHLIARQGFREVAIQGVEFKQLGQGGRMGHYPVHFHLAKSTAYAQGGAFVKDSSVWDSMTRFVVVHGTHDLAISRNVGYLSLGHGYYIEDGSEIENILCHNLGASARGALQQYVSAQAGQEHWCGGEPPPSARLVPPILDGSIQTASGSRADSRIGSDTFMPTMYWMMNAYNEFVGNAAVSVHGFGSCFWLLGAAVSGASRNHQFDGLASFNSTGFQAPLLRFRGNTCMTSPLALPTVREMKPADPNDANLTGFSAIANPYLTNGAPLAKNYDRPIVNGNYRPIQPGAGTTNCSENNSDPRQLQLNTKSCVTTVIDRFATSFNWAEVNFGSIWLRPWFYLFSNGAVTDQLFGGLGFVTGGSWLQAPPAYLSIAMNNLFVGTTQHGGSPFAARSGPIFKITPADNVLNYAPCRAPRITCSFDAEGTGYWKGLFQPKRMISIYDGPAYADGNTFMNVGSWECNPQPCANKSSCNEELKCGIYSSTIQPESPTTPNHMVVVDSAIGWKQPNLFYYPPAFTYRGNAFIKDKAGELNQCLTAAPGNYRALKDQPGGCRHNVFDRTRNYIEGNMVGLNAATPKKYVAARNELQTGPIDFSTILVDLDGSLTGSTGTIDGRSPGGLTSSVSRNDFFDAPSESPECLSFGVQTSPYTFISTTIGKLQKRPSAALNHIDPGKWPVTPAVALYRQWKLPTDTEPCENLCNGDRYGCSRATLMGVSSVHQSSFLTMTEPPGLSSSQPGALYYIDTNSGSMSLSCVKARGSLSPGAFAAGDDFVLYNIFPQRDSVTTYQLYVGESATNLDDIEGRYVRVQIHEVDVIDTNLPPAQKVQKPCDPRTPGLWCSGMPIPTIENGILTIKLDHSHLESSFSAEAREKEDYARCMPRDMCYYNKASKKCERCKSSISSCIRQNDFLQVDLQSMNQKDAAGQAPLDTLCEEWSTLVSGEIDINGNRVTMSDCPAGGCLGFAFTMPQGFTPQPYKAVNESKGLTHCFLRSAWTGDALVQRKNGQAELDPFCGAPRKQTPNDFCSDTELDLPPQGDAEIAQAAPMSNSGDAPVLAVEGENPVRGLVAFDRNAIDSFVADGGLRRATLGLTVAESNTQGEQLVDAHPLVQPFAEGNGGGGDPVGLASAASSVPRRGSAAFVPTDPADGPDGVTWSCAVDRDVSNGEARDCSLRWLTPGGSFGPSTSLPASVAGVPGTVVTWDVTADVLADVSSWLVKKSDESEPGGVAFYSAEGAIDVEDPRVRPFLLLE